MNKNITKEDIREAIAGIKHPAINHTLLDLGIIKDISIENDKTKIILAFPFPNIPIRDYLINSVREPIDKLGIEVDIKVTVMSEEELQRFLVLEQDAWKGNI